MSAALVIIHKQLGGHKWSNTHAVQIGASNSGAPLDADLDAIGCNAALTNANTSTAPTNFLQRLIAFERRMHQPDCMFTDYYVTDGIKNSVGTGFTQYATGTISQPGTGIKSGTGVPSGATLNVGGICLLVHRNTTGYGHKPGRLYLRGVLTENEVIVNGPRMIDWTSSSDFNNEVALVNTSVALGLSTHFYGGANAATALYALPRYSKGVPPDTLPKGSLTQVYPILSLSAVAPVIRQVQRGRRRKKVVTV